MRALLLVVLASVACNSTPSAAPPQNDTTQVTVLARPSDTSGGGDWGDGAAPPPAPTTAPADSSEPTASNVTPTELKTKDPGTYVVDGYVVRMLDCPICPPGVHCKPCAHSVYISAQKPSGSADPPDTVDLQLSDSATYAPGAHYRFVVTVTQSANQSTRRLFSATPE
jgi:hypothetical protein